MSAENVELGGTTNAGADTLAPWWSVVGARVMRWFWRLFAAVVVGFLVAERHGEGVGIVAALGAHSLLTIKSHLARVSAILERAHGDPDREGRRAAQGPT